MTAFGDEPELALGDSGDGVAQLQARLHAIGVYDGAIDGSFGESTAKAVAEVQDRGGLTADGRAGPSTWRALQHAEQQAGVVSPFAPASPDGSAEGADPGGGATAVGALSEDHHWRWDGDGWQANAEPADLVPVIAHDGGRLSADGQWLWDGNRWQPVS
jgi:peptidoglycan hydrolase-like protein with peptidoglycan-binding domain